MNRQVDRRPHERVHSLSNEEMVRLLTAPVVYGDEIEQPWLLMRNAVDLRLTPEELVVTVAGLLGDVQRSLNEYAEGRPELHVRIVRNDDDTFFAVAWQVGSQHMATLRPAPPRAASPPPRPPPRQPAPNEVRAAPAPPEVRAPPVLPMVLPPQPTSMNRGRAAQPPAATSHGSAAQCFGSSALFRSMRS